MKNLRQKLNNYTKRGLTTAGLVGLIVTTTGCSDVNVIQTNFTHEGKKIPVEVYMGQHGQTGYFELDGKKYRVGTGQLPPGDVNPDIAFTVAYEKDGKIFIHRFYDQEKDGKPNAYRFVPRISPLEDNTISESTKDIKYRPDTEKTYLRDYMNLRQAHGGKASGISGTLKKGSPDPENIDFNPNTNWFVKQGRDTKEELANVKNLWDTMRKPVQSYKTQLKLGKTYMKR